MSVLAGFVRDGPLRRDEVLLQGMLQTMAGGQPLGEVLVDGQLGSGRLGDDIGQSGAQPWEEAGVFVWLDGEVYNRPTPADPAASDCQCLMALYRGEGLGALERLDGLFAAIIYDGPQQRLHLVSDRWGLRPLYWSQKGGLAWASQVNGLLQLPELTPCIRPEALEAFVHLGYLWRDMTWFAGIERLPAASVLTWDWQRRQIEIERYWQWDRVALVAGQPRLEELAQELGRLFVEAVQRRSGPEAGLVLSGGLDSRAILAALPPGPAKALTFGPPQSGDARIGARCARLRGAEHRLYPIDSQNWFGPRLEGVWRSGGMLDVLHMHGIEAIEAIRGFFPVVLNGAGGDGLVGAGHLFEPEEFSGYLERNFALTEAVCPRLFSDLQGYFQRLGSAHAFYVEHRMRSFTVYGPLLGAGRGLEFRLPFMDNALQEFLLSVPLGYKANNRLYRQMLLATFPQFYQKIPWQATGVPLSWPTWAVWGRRLLGRLRPSAPLVDYAAWLRCEPVRTWWTGLFEGSEALYPAHLSREKVVGAWRSHLDGDNRQVELGRYATFELLLQQVFADQWKTAAQQPLN